MELYFNGRNLLIIVGYYLIINLILYFTTVSYTHLTLPTKLEV